METLSPHNSSIIRVSSPNQEFDFFHDLNRIVAKNKEVSFYHIYDGQKGDPVKLNFEKSGSTWVFYTHDYGIDLDPYDRSDYEVHFPGHVITFDHFGRFIEAK